MWRNNVPPEVRGWLDGEAVVGTAENDFEIGRSLFSYHDGFTRRAENVVRARYHADGPSKAGRLGKTARGFPTQASSAPLDFRPTAARNPTRTGGPPLILSSAKRCETPRRKARYLSRVVGGETMPTRRRRWLGPDIDLQKNKFTQYGRHSYETAAKPCPFLRPERPSSGFRGGSRALEILSKHDSESIFRVEVKGLWKKKKLNN